MTKKELLNSRGFRDEKHLETWLKESTDKALVAEVKALFEITEEVKVEEVKELEAVEEVLENEETEETEEVETVEEVKETKKKFRRNRK